MARGFDFDRCHRLSHRWDELPGPPPTHADYRRGAILIWLRCDSCGMLKAFEISRRNGDVLTPRYWPQPGYYWTDRNNPARHEPAPLKADYRLDWLRDILKSRGESSAGVGTDLHVAS